MAINTVTQCTCQKKDTPFRETTDRLGTEAFDVWRVDSKPRWRELSRYTSLCSPGVHVSLSLHRSTEPISDMQFLKALCLLLIGLLIGFSFAKTTTTEDPTLPNLYQVGVAPDRTCPPPKKRLPNGQCKAPFGWFNGTLSSLSTILIHS